MSGLTYRHNKSGLTHRHMSGLTHRHIMSGLTNRQNMSGLTHRHISHGKTKLIDTVDLKEMQKSASYATSINILAILLRKLLNPIHEN